MMTKDPIAGKAGVDAEITFHTQSVPDVGNPEKDRRGGDSPAVPPAAKSNGVVLTPCVSHRNLMEAALVNAQIKPSETAFSWLKDDCTIANSFTHAELWHRSGLIGKKLIETHKLKRGDRVMIVFPFGLDFIVAFLACLRVGVVVVSVYPPNPSKLASDIKKFSHFVTDSGSRIALTTGKYASMVRYSGLLHKWPKNLQWVATDSYPRKTPLKTEMTPYDISPEDRELAFVQYTSGSTGNPKGVMVTFANLQHQLYSLSCFPRPYVRYVGWVPQYHDMGLFNILACMYTGTPAWLMSPIQFIQNPVLWPRAIEKFKASWIAGPNFSLGLTCKRLQDQNLRFDCSSVNFCGMGAEPTLPKTLDNAVEVMGIPSSALVNMYGLAEACMFVVGRCHDEGPLVVDNRVSVGSVAWSAAMGIEVLVAEQCSENEMMEVEEGAVGEVCVRSPAVAAGYWQQEELSQSTFGVKVFGREGTYLRTGDMGYVQGDDMFITSRLKDLIIVNGRNIWPSDLETTAESEFAKKLRPGCSTAFQGSEAGAILVCELREPGEEATALALAVKRAVEVECGVALEEVVLVAKGTVPKTTSGKVQRQRTAQLLREGRLKAVAQVAASEGAPLQQATTLAEILEACGVEDWERSVSENGLSSLQIMEVVNMAKQQLGLDIEYEALTDMPASELLALSASDSAQPAHPPLLVSSLPSHLPAPPGAVVRVLLQSLILVLQLAVILAAALPSVALVDRNFEPESRWWLNQGRAGPWLAVAVVIWMLSYTVLCVLCKWVLVGRMRPGHLPLWGFKFTCWMAVERLVAVWEYIVGRFLLETPWLVLVYKLLGAHISWTSRVNAYFRCWDLVTIGPDASVSGLLYPRVFDRHGLRFARIRLGARSSVGSGAVVQAPASVAEEVVVEGGTVVPPHSELGPRGARWHGNLCRPRKLASKSAAAHTGSEVQAADLAADAEPWWLTRALLPVIFLALNVGAFYVANVVIGEVEPRAGAWSRQAWWLAISYVLAFLLTGVQLMGLVVLLKWSFLSPFLTDAITALTISSYLPFIERSPLAINNWHRLLGMRVDSGALILYSWACAPSKAHLCSVGRNSIVFSTVLAPRPPASLWSFLRGRSGAPWTEHRDIVIDDNVGLYVQGRVERGVHVGAGAQLAAFSSVEARSHVQLGGLIAGNPPIRIEKAGAQTEDGAGGVGCGGWVGSVVLFLAHRCFVTTVIALGIHVEKELPGASSFGEALGVYCSVLLRIAVLTAWIVAGELGEMLLYKWVVLGRAREGKVSFKGWKALLMMHGSMMWDQSLPLCSAFLSGGFGINLALRLLGFNIDIARVLCTNLPCVPSQDAELITIEADAIVDEFAYVSAHNATVEGITLAPTRVGAGAVLHPLAGLFISTLAPDASLYPRAKSLREMTTGQAETWVGMPAYRAECEYVEVPLDSAVTRGAEL